MRQSIVYVIPVLIALMTSCGGWVGSQEKAFMNECLDSFEKGYERSGGELEKDKARQVCDCTLQKVKEEYSFDQFVAEQGSDKISKIMEGCTEDVFGIEIN